MNRYEDEAQDTAETLFDNGLDLERFMPALVKAVLDRATEIVEADVYDSPSVNWAETQIREAKLYMDSVNEASSDLGAALSQVLATDDTIIVGHIRTAYNLLENLRRRLRVMAA